MAWSIYLKAALITGTIFVAGVLVGWFLENQRNVYIQEQLTGMEEQLAESRLALLYYQVFSEDPSVCSSLMLQMDDLSGRVEEMRIQLKGYKDQYSIIQSEELKRSYILLNSELWLYATNLKRICNSSEPTTILYFYPDSEVCIDCEAQAHVLNGIKERCQDRVWVFAFPADLDVGICPLLVNQFDITMVPSIVVDEKTKIEGLQTLEQIREKAPALSSCIASGS